MPAKGSAEWSGDVPTGTSSFTAGDTISGGYTYKSRFENGPGSNPEQLVGAAHAACFSMALARLEEPVSRRHDHLKERGLERWIVSDPRDRGAEDQMLRVAAGVLIFSQGEVCV
jgi:hypothetical protein